YDLTSGGGQDIFVAKLIPTSPLGAASIPAAAAAGALAPQQVWPTFDEALARWAAAGANTSGLRNVDVPIANLPDDLLGLEPGPPLPPHQTPRARPPTLPPLNEPRDKARARLAARR